MSNIRLEMPVLSRHEGEWSRIYTVVYITGKNIRDRISQVGNIPYEGNYYSRKICSQFFWFVMDA